MSAAADQEAAARAQIEYYFSYANYSRDEYLRSLADADGYVALDALQDFPKLHKLTQGDGALLKRAAASSTRLEVSEDDKVRARRIGASSTGRQAQHLVLDANALVRGRGAALQAYADNFWTTTEVLAEVKDAESRARLAALPFRLETRRPSPQAVDRVSQFARKTGDLASLSPVDVQVLALAYDLEVEAAGSDDHLRREPEGTAAPCAKKEPAAVASRPAPRPKPRPAAARTAPPPVSWAAAVTAPPPPVAEAPVEEPEAAPEPAPVPPPAVEEPPAPLPPPPPEIDEAITADGAAAPPSRILAGNAIGAMDAADDDGVGWLDADDVQAAVATGELAFDGLLLAVPLAGGPRGHLLEQPHAEERNGATKPAVVAAADELAAREDLGHGPRARPLRQLRPLPVAWGDLRERHAGLMKCGFRLVAVRAI